MTEICISDGVERANGLYYIKNSVSELCEKASAGVKIVSAGNRARLLFDCPEYYADIMQVEIADRVAEVIAVGYKYGFFKREIKISGLDSTEKEILLASLISADLKEDKKYVYDRIKPFKTVNIDGFYNFRLRPLAGKWRDIAEYMPTVFVNSQLKDFIAFLLENKKKRTYIDDCKVYDNYYRRLKRCSLLDGEEGKIVREVLLSGCGEVEIRGSIPETDEKYLKAFYGDKIFFCAR